MRILFVCLGNICRSPLAEAIFKHRIKEEGLEGKYKADSCGTHNYNVGDPSDRRTVRNAMENQITVDHIARQFTAEDFERFDLILTMDRKNRSFLLRMNQGEPATSKIRMMRSFDPANPDGEVPDPYYGNDDDFQQVFDILDRSVSGLIRYLKDNKKN